MANDTVTLTLHGDGAVSLGRFADAISQFDALVQALARDRGSKGVEWQIADLEVSSAIVTARGVSNGAGTAAEAEEVVRGFVEVGRALEAGETIPFAAPVRTAAEKLTKVLDGEVKAIRFETAEGEATVNSPAAPLLGKSEPPIHGAVEGRVQTLTSRGGLRFTLYDTLHDRAVSCYLAESHEDVMRDAWGRRAIVEGLVTREATTGRPLTVREVTAVELLSELPLPGYRALRGRAPSALSAEEAIRRLRDAG